MKAIKFTEKELSILRTLSYQDVCRYACFDETKQDKAVDYCEKCWVRKTIERILEKVGE
jgi:hypothetical protein